MWICWLYYVWRIGSCFISQLQGNFEIWICWKDRLPMSYIPRNTLLCFTSFFNVGKARKLIGQKIILIIKYKNRLRISALAKSTFNVLQKICQQIRLDPATLTCRFQYLLRCKKNPMTKLTLRWEKQWLFQRRLRCHRRWPAIWEGSKLKKKTFIFRVSFRT